MATIFTPHDDVVLLQKERLFEAELTPHLDAVYGFARHLTNDAERAEDLAQETFMKAWRFLEGYTPGTNAKAWLFRICKNVFINDYRSNVRKPHTVDFEDFVVYHNESEQVAPSYLNLREDLAEQEMGDEVVSAIDSLPAVFREVLLLDLDDFSYEEIAKLVEVPIGTVRSRLHRARNLMADKLREYASDFGYGVQDNEQQTANETATFAEAVPGEVAAPSATAFNLI